MLVNSVIHLEIFPVINTVVALNYFQKRYFEIFLNILQENIFIAQFLLHDWLMNPYYYDYANQIFISISMGNCPEP